MATKELTPAERDERIKKGLAVTKEAIAKKDIPKLKRCLQTFKTLEVPLETIISATADCPDDLLAGTGFVFKVPSETLSREIAIGAEVSWWDVRKLCRMDLTGQSFSYIIDTLALFKGKLVDPLAGDDVPQEPNLPKEKSMLIEKPILQVSEASVQGSFF